MVPIVENWAEVIGRIQAFNRNGPLAGHGVAILQVEQVSNVPDYANLLEGFEGHILEVNLPAELDATIKPKAGSRVRLRLCRGTPSRILAHPTIAERLAQPR